MTSSSVKARARQIRTWSNTPWVGPVEPKHPAMWPVGAPKGKCISGGYVVKLLELLRVCYPNFHSAHQAGDGSVMWTYKIHS